ncbi:MAG: VCBS repeat-containing protein, partial [Oscillospiraceae bacterium]|nr:VCBS repeat-containing protein [Oscillospiraceae bacterium]
MNKKRICALLAALTLFLSGCGGSTADELYALPRLSDAYLQLQNEINELLDEGAEYSAPSSGSNRQAVQLEDIDGDGVKEALAFLSQPGASKPQKIVIFRSIGGKYTEVARIEGEGSGIDSISYLDMDGSPGREIAVGWRIASGMNILSVYSMRGFQPAQILNTDYTRFSAVDIDDNGTTDVVVLRLSSSEENGEAAMYSLQEDGEMASSTVLLSQGIRSLARVRSGRLMDGRPSLIVESTIGV